MSQEPVGLLDQVAASALDDDYYLVRPTTDPGRRWHRWLTAVALGTFTLMVTIAALQTRADRPATEREQRALAEDVELRREQRADRLDLVGALQSQVGSLRVSADRRDPVEDELAARTGASDVRGPGLVLTLTPAASDGGPGAVSDTDLQGLANQFWALGAEAIGINDQRLGTLSSIRVAGAAVTVNYASINPPYRLEIIGDAEDLEQRWTSSALGRDWASRSAAFGVGVDLDDDSDLRLPAVPESRQRLSDAMAVAEGTR